VASSPTRSASLSCRAFSRHTSKVGAVCVEALVRICAGGDQGRKTLVANKIVLKSKELTSIALTCLTLRDFHEVSRAGGPIRTAMLVPTASAVFGG